MSGADWQLVSFSLRMALISLALLVIRRQCACHEGKT